MLVFPMAFYGSEIAPLAVKLVAQLASAIAAAIGPHNTSSSNAITFLTSTKKVLELGADDREIEQPVSAIGDASEVDHAEPR